MKLEVETTKNQLKPSGIKTQQQKAVNESQLIKQYKLDQRGIKTHLRNKRSFITTFLLSVSTRSRPEEVWVALGEKPPGPGLAS